MQDNLQNINISPDASLWEELRKGSEKAFREIYLNNVKILHNYGFKFTSDEQLTEDCIQDVFTDIFRNHKTLGPTDNIRLYLFTSLRRRIIKELQKRKVPFLQDETEIAFEPQYFETIPDNTNPLFNTLHNLPPRQKEVIFLRFYEDMEYEEICQVMGMNYQSVRNLMHRAIQTLRARAEGKGK